MIGTLLNGFQITDKIKQGSVGIIYKATDAQGKVYALKRISEKNAKSPEKVKAFKKEAMVVKELTHKNIIKVYDYYEVEPMPFFTMEYFESDNLKFVITNYSTKVSSYEFNILKQIAESLNYIHSAGIVHRDIKPENVLVNKELSVRLIDFSIAQTKWDRIMQFGKKIDGTPQYMAPEQIQGKRVDNRADIYSFGILSYELLTKKPLFTGVTENALLEKHLKEPAPRLPMTGNITKDVADILQKMLAKKPEERPSNLDMVIYEFTKFAKIDLHNMPTQIISKNTK